MTYSGLIAADFVICPTQPTDHSLAGIGAIGRALAAMQADLGQAPGILGIIATQTRAGVVGHYEGLSKAIKLPYPFLGNVPRREGRAGPQELASQYETMTNDILKLMRGKQ